MRQRHIALLMIPTTLAFANPSSAADGVDKSGYTLFRPTPDSAMRDMSTDRPDKTESAYTVDAGHVQIETDLVSFTRDRAHGTTTNSLDVAPVNLKVGLTNQTDIQFVFDTHTHVRTKNADGTSYSDSGSGDLTLRLKHNLWGNDGGDTAFAIMPFVKLPTSQLDDANDDVEGGIILPLAIDLKHGMGLGLMTEVDILRSETDGDYQPTFINSATVSFELTTKIGLYTELFVERSAESGAHTIVTFDAGITCAVTDNLQLDTGVNIGLTDAADDLNVFAGLSRRF